MKFLLDTCVISELIKPYPDQKVVQWISSVDEDELVLSVLTFGELRKGIGKLQESKRKSDLIQWLASLEDRFRYKIMDINLEVCMRWGQISAESERAGRPIPAIDGLICATALINRCIVVTRNTDDMNIPGLEIINPWNS